MLFTGCGDNKDDDNPASTAKYALVSETRAQAVSEGGSTEYQTHFVNTSGVVSTATVTYTVSPDSIGSFTGSKFTAGKPGTGTVTATATFEGITYTTVTPVNVLSAKTEDNLFVVSPAAVIWTTGAGTIDLWPVFLGQGSTSFTFASSNTGIVTVSATGEITFVAPGSATITVNGTCGGKTGTFKVPVLVTGKPDAPLPVTRVEISKKSWLMFKNETEQFTVKAYNSSGQDVTSQFPAVWTLSAKDTVGGPLPVSVDSTGKVTALALGDAYLKVTVAGITDQAEINVYPEKFLYTDSLLISLNAGQSKTVSVKAFQITDKAAFRANNGGITQITLPNDIVWAKLLTGISEMDQFMNNVNFSGQNGGSITLTGKTDAMPGTFTNIYVYSPSNPDMGPAVIVALIGIDFNPFP
ncbi:MAG: Ig-like domain-containing protein [Bacteroidota bacterium]